MPDYAVITVNTNLATTSSKNSLVPYINKGKQGKQQVGGNIAEEDEEKMINTKRFAAKALSTILASLSLANSAVGSYTGNKVRQYNNQQMIKLAGIGVGAIFNPSIALSSAALLAIRQGVNLSIRQKNSEQQSEYKRSYLGNMTTSGSRWRGGR